MATWEELRKALDFKLQQQIALERDTLIANGVSNHRVAKILA